MVSTLNVNYGGRSSNPTTWKEAVGVDNDRIYEFFFGLSKKKRFCILWIDFFTYYLLSLV
jgi:hypothetical protein